MEKIRSSREKRLTGDNSMVILVGEQKIGSNFKIYIRSV